MHFLKVTLLCVLSFTSSFVFASEQAQEEASCKIEIANLTGEKHFVTVAPGESYTHREIAQAYCLAANWPKYTNMVIIISDGNVSNHMQDDKQYTYEELAQKKLYAVKRFIYKKDDVTIITSE